jgi:uncharacterized protein (DUF58 family)
MPRPAASGTSARADGVVATGTRDAPVDPQLAEILRQVRRIELRTRHLVSALAAGRFRSAFRGQGMEFDQVRAYVDGDDVRAIDWNVTARSGQPYVKIWREERELAIQLVVDVSASMRFGAIPGISPRAKLALAAEATAVLALLALKNHDRVGLTLASDRTELHLPARRGRSHALRLVREVLVPRPAGDGRSTDLTASLAELERTARRRCLVLVISDFLPAGGAGPRPGALGGALARLARRHQLVGLRISDPAEESLPALGMPLAVEDPEDGGLRVLSGSPRVAAAYAQRWQANREAGRALFNGVGCDLVDCHTDRGALPVLARYFRSRRRRPHA